jgi:transposase
MARGHELTAQLQSRICELRSIGYSYGQIATIHPEVKRSTIITTCRREQLRDDNKTRPRSGPPRKLTEEHRDHVYDLISHQDPHIKIRDLCAEVDHVVKERSIQRLCRELDRRKWKQRLRPEITEIHAQKRLQWAQTYEHFTPAD